jgi:uncharacterized protein
MKPVFKVFILLSLILLFLTGCKTDDLYPDPTNEFYVNDFADTLVPAVESTIVREGERLYEEVSEDGEISGVQIVFATFAVESESNIAEYNITDIYNQWGIGTDDMGILVVYFYVGDEDKPEELVLSEVYIYTGFTMEMYLSPIEAGNILDETIMTDMDESMATAQLLYELLTVVYVEVFEYEAFNYDMDEYQIYLDNYDDYGDYDDIWGWVIYVILSPYSVWWEKGVLLIAAALIFGVGGGVVKNIGGGGKSGGMGIRRRR